MSFRVIPATRQTIKFPCSLRDSHGNRWNRNYGIESVGLKIPAARKISISRSITNSLEFVLIRRLEFSNFPAIPRRSPVIVITRFVGKISSVISRENIRREYGREFPREFPRELRATIGQETGEVRGNFARSLIRDLRMRKASTHGRNRKMGV